MKQNSVFQYSESSVSNIPIVNNAKYFAVNVNCGFSAKIATYVYLVSMNDYQNTSYNNISRARLIQKYYL